MREMSTVKLTGLSLIMAAVLLEVFAQLAIKRGTARAAKETERYAVFRYLTRLARDAWIQCSVALHVVELLLWIAALKMVPLSVAFPIGSLSYAGVALGGHYWQGEKLDGRAAAAIAMIMAGVTLICWVWV
jgi:drug/metabolite transporter (DMT)-like permease